MRTLISDKIREAHMFAIAAHGAIGQVRKHSGEPYTRHLERVADIVMLTPKFTTRTVCAALLHDVLEDTRLTEADLLRVFESELVDIVVELTKPPLSAGNRARRHDLYLDGLREATIDARLIKLADIADNVVSIAMNDPEFAEVYVPEVEEIWHDLHGTDWTLSKLVQDELTKARRVMRARIAGAA